MNVVFHEAALDEFDAAVAYYRKISDRLADAFVAETEHGVQRIRDYPDAWQALGRGIRRYLLNRFPYGLVYRVRDDSITVYAVMHLHRRPGYWRERTQGS